MIKFSATISASDAVAALTIIKATEFPKLFSIVFGEGLVNDAVAIILFKVVGDIFTES
ncbi:cation:proton antiporter [candidate division KSB1 bacterium]|nr:cation:proton antiporter [candidate division KSB1 bacterium]